MGAGPGSGRTLGVGVAALTLAMAGLLAQVDAQSRNEENGGFGAMGSGGIGQGMMGQGTMGPGICCCREGDLSSYALLELALLRRTARFDQCPKPDWKQPGAARAFLGFDPNTVHAPTDGPLRCRPSVHEMDSPWATPDTCLPRLRSRTGRHGTSVNSRLFSMSANRPLARSSRRR